MSTRRRHASWIVAVLVAAGLATAAPAHAQPDQRVAYAFDEGAGTSAADSSTTGTNATITAATWTPSGRYGSALVFDGATSRVRSTTDIALGASFTYGAWMRNPSRQTYETIMTVGWNRNFFISDGVLGYYDGAADVSFGAALPDGVWHYVSLVSDGTSVRAYVDGVLHGQSAAFTTAPSSGPLQVGAGVDGAGGADWFSGTLDEVRLHTRALSAAEILADRNAAIAAPAGGGDTTAPVASNGQPTGTLPAGTTQTTMTATTDEPATCRYGPTSAAYTALPTPFTTTGATTHSTPLTGLTDGTAYTRYIRCQDAAGNAATTDLVVTFTVAAPAADTTPPVASDGRPTGTLPAGTTQTTLQATTDEPATCRYGPTSATYAALPTPFTTTGGTAHSSVVTGLTDGTSYTWFVRCSDAAGNAATADLTITFAVAAASGWTATTSLPVGLSGNGAVQANGYMYVVGGLDSAGNVVSTVRYSRIAADGTLGPWNTTTAYPQPIRSTRPVFSNGYLYVAGGSNGGAYTSGVRYARVNADGTIGAWTSTTSLPVAQLSHSTVAVGGYVYVVGGNQDPCVATVRYARVNTNGSLGAWNTTSALPAPRCGVVEAAAAANGWLYLVAGYDNTDVTTSVFSARINADGTLGTWRTNATRIATPREYLGVEIWNGAMYVIAGQPTLFSTVTGAVERAPINADGTVGSFSAYAALPGPRGYLATEVVNGFLYAIGGGTTISGGNPQSSVFVTPATGGGEGGGGGGDTTPPTVALTAPANGSTVSGTAAVSANASDGVGVAGVQFLLDGVVLGAEDTVAPYAVGWDTTTAANGGHTLTARARDAAGNETFSAPVTVTVGNAAAGPRLAYGLAEGSGTTVDDSGSAGVDATAVAPTWTTAGRYGNAIVFNGTTSRVRTVADVTVGSSFTISAWVRNPTAGAYETIVAGPSRDLYLASGVLNFWTGAVNLSFGPALSTTDWQHVALVADGTTVRAYVNGVQRGATQDLALLPGTGPVQLGAWAFGGADVDFFSGTLDEVRLYNRAQSAAEIAADMAAAIGPPAP